MTWFCKGCTNRLLNALYRYFLPQSARERVDDALAAVRADLALLASLPENWDEEGGGPYPRLQLSRIEKWWQSFLAEYRNEFAQLPPVPRIGQAEDQSIDVHWDGDFSLLVNVPADAAKPCTFYGFSVIDPCIEFQGKLPLKRLGATIKPIVKDFCA